jgi:thiol-disulfide isomerase/thioredoxin
MKKFYKVIVLCLFCYLPLHAQPLNQTIIERSDSSLIAYGYFDRNLFEIPQFNSWFKAEYDNYKPDKKTIKTLLRKLPNDVSIIIVMGTWCPDSRREVPRFYKICDIIGIKPDVIIGIAVDREKTTKDVNMEHLKIDKVPTFIFYRNDKETGKIIETPTQLLEKDLLEILRKKPE